jgi:Skp family chaperone for outer membrane proteins
MLCGRNASSRKRNLWYLIKHADRILIVRTARAQRATDVPVAVTQELAKLRMDYADLLGQHQSQTGALSRKEGELQKTEGLLSASQHEVEDLRVRLQIAEATNLRTEKRTKTAQQEVELLNSLLVGHRHQGIQMLMPNRPTGTIYKSRGCERDY